MKNECQNLEPGSVKIVQRAMTNKTDHWNQVLKAAVPRVDDSLSTE